MLFFKKGIQFPGDVMSGCNQHLTLRIWEKLAMEFG